MSASGSGGGRYGKVYQRKGSRRSRENLQRALLKRKALDAVGVGSWRDIANLMGQPGTSVPRRPTLQVAQFTWTTNKAALVINQGGSVSLLSNFPQGSADYQRHTNKTITYKVDLRMVTTYKEAFVKNSFKMRVYWWLVYDKAPTGSMPTCSTIFDTFYMDMPSTWTVSRDVCHRFVVKHKWVSMLSSNGVSTSADVSKTPVLPSNLSCPTNKFFKGLGVTTEWKNNSTGDIGDIKEGALYLCCAGDCGKDNVPLAYGKMRVYFKSIGNQ